MSAPVPPAREINRRIVLNHGGGPEVLRIVDTTLYPAEAGHVQVRVEAAGVTYHDLLERRGLREPGTRIRYPYTIGVELTGVITALGAGVTTLSVGQRIVAAVEEGGYASFASVEAWRCVPVPDGLDPRQVVALTVNYWTAYHTLHKATNMQSGQRILIHGGAGGLGLALLQLAKVIGVEAYATASQGKHDIIRQFGGVPIDYKSEDFVKRILELTGDGVDVVSDPIGPSNWARSYSVLRRNGALVVVGALDEPTFLRFLGAALQFLACKLWPDSKNMKAVFLSPIRLKADYLETLPILLELLRTKQIDPVIGAEFPLDQAAEAHRLMERSGVSGKIVLIP